MLATAAQGSIAAGTPAEVQALRARVIDAIHRTLQFLRHGTWVSSPVNDSVQCLGRVPSCAGVSCLQLPYWPELEPSAEWALYQSCSAILRKATRTAGVGHQQKGRPCALEQWQSHAECKPTTALVSGCFNMALFRGRRLMAIISMLPCTFHS